MNDIVWVKVKKSLWQGRVIQTPYSIKEEDSEHMKIKWVDSRKEERVLIKNVSIGYSKKRVSVPTQQYYNGSYMKETDHNLTKNETKKKSTTTTDKDDVEGSFN